MIDPWFRKKNITFLAVILLWSILIASLIPFFIYAKYDNPSADDFSYSIEVKNEFNNSHSILKAFYTGIQRTRIQYNNWQGTYFGSFIMTLNPYSFSSGLYKFAPVILIIMLIFSIWILSMLISRYILKISIIYAYILTAYISLVSLNFLPSLTQGIYWFNGAWYYTFAYCLSLLFVSILIVIINSKNRKLVLFLKIIAPILIILLGGENFTTSSSILLFMSVFSIVLLYKKKKNSIYILSLTIILLICVIIVYIAPGNAHRIMAVNKETSFIFSIIHAIYGGMYFLFKWILHSYVLLFSILILPLLKKQILKLDYNFKKPFLILIVTFLLFSAQFFPPLYGLDGLGPDRLKNIIFFSSIWLVLFNITYIYGYILKNDIIKINKSNNNYKKIYFITIILLLLISFFSYSYKNISIYYVSKNILNGDAAKYNTEYNERIKKITNSNDSNILVNEFSVKPKGLFFRDITNDENNWMNQSLSKYFDIESISLK